MKKILIPTDFSQNSKNAIRYSLDMFKETSCHFFLLYVNIEGSDLTEKPIYNFGTNIIVEKEPKAVSQKVQDLEKFVVSISSKKKHHQFTTIRENGFFLKTIREHIKEKEIDLIVMGTRGASELKEFFMGTRSGDVIAKVECDVLVIPDKVGFKGLGQVIFPVDFEINYSDDTLKRMVNLISSERAHIHLLYVTKSQIPIFEEVTVRQKQLQQQLSKIVHNPISFQRIISKNVAKGITDFAKNLSADLIVMISKEYGLLQRLFKDTTVEELSFDTKIPLLSLKN
ncbi:universal stress protein [Maribacter chungangensis]|uniref:Universal stress protein n=1 Tax=Maribacter chungangensis TaxID=1069117 RepID=A0ABW3B279_9FLAO